MTTKTQHIIAAADRLATRPGGPVRLTALRAALPAIDRNTLDALLLDLDDDRLIALEPDPDRLGLTADDHAAAVDLAGRQMHLLRVRAK